MPTKSSGSSVRGTRKSTRRRRKVEEEPEAPAAEEVVEEAPAPAPAERSSDDNDDYDRAEGGDDNTEQQEGERSERGGDRPPRRRRRRRRSNQDSDRQDNRRGGQRGQRGGRGGGRHGGGGGGGGRRNNRRRAFVAKSTYTGEDIEGTIDGVLEMHPKGYGFLRDPQQNYQAQESDAFVSSSLIEKHKLREGILIRGEVGPGTRGQGPRLKEIELIDGRTIEEFQEIKVFDDLTAITPESQIQLEKGPMPITMRVMDILTPVGKGQRALIVAPPRTGKTMLLQDIADSVSVNHPEVHLMVLLIDERPEEVTEMRRRVHGEVIASSMDREVESHVRISQLIIERGKRLAEAGKDVFILLDSITRTARAFNKWGGNTGRTMTGGLDVKALDIPKKMFGTARQFDEGGSLTIVATALIDTGSRMDEVIFQEFKGTGNMELVLSRDLADRRIWPAIDITKSGTRHEEKLVSPEAMESITLMRRALISLSPIDAMEDLTRNLSRFPQNEEFLTRVRDIL
ncbi:MAG: transcription termination factor Rho [Planctomycetaceae bacterium]|nr:transcription termination factor Rho [Planctomycetaceae bacterium]